MAGYDKSHHECNGSALRCTLSKTTWVVSSFHPMNVQYSWGQCKWVTNRLRNWDVVPHPLKRDEGRKDGTGPAHVTVEARAEEGGSPSPAQPQLWVASRSSSAAGTGRLLLLVYQCRRVMTGGQASPTRQKGATARLMSHHFFK